MALVYGKDYYGSDVWPGAYGLKSIIDNLCWISRTFAIGAYQVRYIDQEVHVATRDGNGGVFGRSGGLLTAINFNVLSPRIITCDTPFGAHRQLHDYSGHHGDIWTDAHGRATFTIPSNAWSGGTSYLCFAPAGVSLQYPVRSLRTTQTFTGDLTLDVMPARNGTHDLPQSIYCAAASKLLLTWNAFVPALSSSAWLRVSVLSPSASELAFADATSKHDGTLSCVTHEGGWHIVRLTGEELPEAGVNFRLTVDYLGAYEYAILS